METEPRDELQRFFDTLYQGPPGSPPRRGTAPRAIPKALHDLGRAVAERLNLADPRSSGEELVSELLLRILDRDTSEYDTSDLRPLEARALRSVLRHRLNQVGTEHLPGWQRIKTLRARVREVLAQGLPPSPEEEPASIYSGERLDRARLAKAVAWERARASEPLSVSELTRELARRYDVYPASDDAEERSRDLVRDIERPREHEEGMRWLMASFSDEELGLMRARLQDMKLADLAREHGLAIATVHAWHADLRARLGEIVEALGLSPSVLNGLFDDLLKNPAALRRRFARPAKPPGRAKADRSPALDAAAVKGAPWVLAEDVAQLAEHEIDRDVVVAALGDD